MNQAQVPTTNHTYILLTCQMLSAANGGSTDFPLGQHNHLICCSGW